MELWKEHGNKGTPDVKNTIIVGGGHKQDNISCSTTRTKIIEHHVSLLLTVFIWYFPKWDNPCTGKILDTFYIVYWPRQLARILEGWQPLLSVSCLFQEDSETGNSLFPYHFLFLFFYFEIFLCDLGKLKYFSNVKSRVKYISWKHLINFI